jgi:hypothetical protein
MSQMEAGTRRSTKELLQNEEHCGAEYTFEHGLSMDGVRNSRPDRMLDHRPLNR